MQCCFASFNEEKRIEIGGGNVSVRLWKILEISLWKWEKFMLKKYRSTISWCWTIGIQFSAPLVSPIASVKASLFNEGRNVRPRIGPHLERLFLILYPFAIIIDRDRSNLDLSRFFAEHFSKNHGSSWSEESRGFLVHLANNSWNAGWL